MRKTGSVCEFNAERDAAIMRAYRMEIETCARVCIDTVASRVVSYPCSRFWVSEERAANVVSSMMRGVAPLDGMLPTKRRMFEEIHRRVVELRNRRGRASLYSLVCEVVNSEAPEFYMSPRYARDIIVRKIGKAS